MVIACRLKMSSAKVLIIGAGAAGIAAACHLHEAGMNDFIVLEAEDRVGGRVHFADICGDSVDLGASSFKEAEFVSMFLKNLKSCNENVLFLLAPGEIVPWERISLLLGLLPTDKKYEQHESYPVASVSKEQFQKLKSHNTLSENDLCLAFSFIEWHLKFMNMVSGTDLWCKSSFEGMKEYCTYNGHQIQRLRQGKYRNILDIVQNSYLSSRYIHPVAEKIHVNKEVIKIQWDNTYDRRDKMVEVACEDGSVYAADYVVVTVSLGVLKQRSSTLFSPSLPRTKLDAIKHLKYSCMDKILIKFPYRWWPENKCALGLLWPHNKTDRKQNNVHSVDDWLKHMCFFSEVTGSPLTLCGWISGDLAERMEHLSDQEVCASVMDLLNSFAGNIFNIPAPESFTRSCWVTNTHFCGSHRYHSLKDPADEQETMYLTQPITNSKGRQVLFFAGEATHECLFSTLHGAIETGWREAARILEISGSDDTRTIKPFHIPMNETHLYKVVIIGAGIAGLAAAKTLVEGGIKNIVILEAQDYAGGRIRSAPVGTGWLELGAQWIHGQNNEVYRLAHSSGLLSDVVSAEGLGQYIRDDGFMFNPDVVSEVQKVISDILEECENFVSQSDSQDRIPLSIGHFLRQKFSGYLDACTSDTPDTRQMKEELYDWHVRFQVIDNSCYILDMLSAKSWGKYVFCGGEDYVNFKNGYSSLINNLIQQLPEGILKLNTPVVKVKWKQREMRNTKINLSNNGEICEDVTSLQKNSDSPYMASSSNKKDKTLTNLEDKSSKNENSFIDATSTRVTCNNGETYTAEHVVVTTSLGFLKRHHEQLFEPPLPSDKIQAIEEMGFAAINKIFLVYREPWWTSDTKGFQLIWSKNNNLKPNRAQLSSWTRDLTGFDVIMTHQAVLLGWVGGIGAQLVEELPEDVVGQHCTELLKHFTQRNDIPDPTTVIRTQWYSNEYICGGYSNTSSYCDISNSGPSTLSTPVYSNIKNKCGSDAQIPSLLLAGEATHDSYFSTTHGAYETGMKKAQIILDYQRKRGM